MATAASFEEVHITEDTWSCPVCTFINKRCRPGCGMCGTERPEDAMPEKGIQRILFADAQKLVVPDKVFDCPSCLIDIEPGDGVRLRECLCDVCKECMCTGIRARGDGRMECPRCQLPVCDRDMKNLISAADWDDRLKKVLKNAEVRIREAFHCLTPDCLGWAEMESLTVDESGQDCPFFLCLCCSTVNCIACKAQHEGKTCEDHRRETQLKKDFNMTLDYLDELLKNGEAMKCPECQSIVQRISGCGYVACGNPSCRLPLCWWTKGRRWGPGGRGDISQGCRCRVDGKRCHKDCWWCDS